MKSLVAVAAALAIVATSVSAAAQSVQVLDDKFSQAATFLGPAQSKNPFGGTFRLWRLRSWVNKRDMSIRHQLYVQTNYMWNWRFWEVAATDRAEPLSVIPINRALESCDNGICSYNEIVGVDIPDQMLRERAKSGFELKLSAKSGDALVLSVSAQQVQEQVAVVDAYVSALSVKPNNIP